MLCNTDSLSEKRSRCVSDKRRKGKGEKKRIKSLQISTNERCDCRALAYRPRTNDRTIIFKQRYVAESSERVSSRSGGEKRETAGNGSDPVPARFILFRLFLPFFFPTPLPLRLFSFLSLSFFPPPPPAVRRCYSKNQA